MMQIETDIQNVFMVIRFDIYNETNKFTDEQKSSLSSIIDKTNDIDFKTNNPWKLAKNVAKTDKILKEFEKTFASYGGNVEALENKLKEIKANKIKAACLVFKLR